MSLVLLAECHRSLGSRCFSALLRNTNTTGFVFGDAKSVSVDSVGLRRFTINREELRLFGRDWQLPRPRLCVTGSLKSVVTDTFSPAKEPGDFFFFSFFPQANELLG